MPMTATMAPYTLFILDDDTPLNPREDHDCLGKMVCWHSRYSLGEKHDYDEPSDFLRSLLFSEYSSGHDRNNPVFAFLKSGKAKDARLEYNRSTREWELRENQHWSSENDWYACAVHVPHLNDFNTDLVEMRKGRSVEDLDRQRMAELETAFEQSAEEEPEQGMEV